VTFLFFVLLLMEEMAFHIVKNAPLVSIQHGYSGLQREIRGLLDVHVNDIVHGFFIPSTVGRHHLC